MFLFVGAGLSTAFGIPDMSGFVELFDGEHDASHLYRRVRDHMGENPNLEALMTILSDLAKPRDQLLKTIAPQTASFLLSDLANAEEYVGNDTAIEEARTILVAVQKTIFSECIGAMETGRSQVLSVFDALFEAVMDVRLPNQPANSGDGRITYPQGLYIYTTNYDTALEEYWSLRQTEIGDGLVHDSITKTFQLTAKAELFTSGFRPVLFKSHGCVQRFRKESNTYNTETGRSYSTRIPMSSQ